MATTSNYLSMALDVIINLKFIDYICILFVFQALYTMLICPLIFFLCIKPRIENRYKTKLSFTRKAPISKLALNYLMPSLEVGIYIFLHHVNLKKCYMIQFEYLALKKINYNINTATKMEIVTSYITVITLVYSLFACAFIFIYGHWICPQ